MASRTLAFLLAEATSRLSWLDSGSGSAYLLVYGTDKPPVAGQDAGGSHLLRINLAKPSGVILADGSLQLIAGTALPAAATGTAKWGRLFNGGDVAGLDMSVTSFAGDGEVKLSRTALVTGVVIRMLLSSIK